MKKIPRKSAIGKNEFIEEKKEYAISGEKTYYIKSQTSEKKMI